MQNLSEKRASKSLCAKLSYENMKQCLRLMKVDTTTNDLERDRVTVARIRESNRAVAIEVKRVATLAECRRMGMGEEARDIA
jgi:hypothetical protein